MELKLYNTTSSKLNSLNIVGGQLIVSKDDSCLYVDIDSIGRLKITDWIELETDNDRLAVLAPISGKIYYVSETNAIWKYVKDSWKCLNEVNKEEIFAYVLENLQSYLDAKVPTSRKINGKVLTSDIALSAADVGAVTTSDIATAKTEVNKYTDDKIALLVNNSSTAIDSINELAKAMEDNSDAISALESIASGHALKDHEHNYAGSSSVGGSANSAVKLDSSAGSALQPVFFENGKPKAIKHTLNATVPSDAKFTDTIYTHPSHEKKDSGLYKVSVDSEGHVHEAIPVTKSDITSLGIPAQDTTYTLSSFGVNATSTELNYVDGVTSNIQNQLDDKVPTSRKINGKSLTSDITLSASDVGATTQEYVDNQISALGNTYYTENEVDAKIDDINDAIDTKSDLGHNHDDKYYTENEIDNKISELNTVINKKSDNTHNHNDDYSAINHKHTVSEVTDISNHYYNQTQIDSKINAINNNIENKSDVGHGHSVAEITNLQTSLNDKVSTSRRINNKPLTSDITITAADLGALTTSDIVSVKNEVNDYTDQQIANLLNNSTEAVDSIYELRDAMEDNADAIESLVAISGNKANASDLANHINNKSNPHNVTKEQLGLYASTWYGTKAEYDAIENKQEDCLYIVTDYTADGMYEVTTNKINVINKNSTDEQYPTAKAVYDVVQNSLEPVNDSISSINDTIGDVITSISDVNNAIDNTNTNISGVNDKIDTHVSNKENPHNVTAEQIGAVPITGTTLKGQLGINNGYGKVESYDANVLLRTMYPANDSNNSRRITLYNKNNKDDTRYALQLNETINGATTSYNIYGEHNKDLLAKALPIISNPNLLDNWYFVDPINQRNGYILLKGTLIYADASLTNLIGAAAYDCKVGKITSSYAEVLERNSSVIYYASPADVVPGYIENGYVFDRWINQRGGYLSKVALSESGIVLEDIGGAVTNVILDQKSDLHNGGFLHGKTVTASVLVKEVSGDLCIQSGGKTIVVRQPGLHTFTTVYNMNNINYLFRLYNSTANTRAVVVAAKLELGSQQTLARQENGVWVLNDPPPNKQQELTKCQRYFVGQSAYAKWTLSHVTYGGYLMIEIPLPVTLRSTSVSLIRNTNQPLSIYCSSGWTDISGIGFTVYCTGNALYISASSSIYSSVVSLTAGMSYLTRGLPDISADL